MAEKELADDEVKDLCRPIERMAPYLDKDAAHLPDALKRFGVTEACDVHPDSACEYVFTYRVPVAHWPRAPLLELSNF